MNKERLLSRVSARWVVALATVLFVTAAPRFAEAAASARAASGRWFIKAANADSDSVWFGTLGWATRSAINWTLPIFTADGAAVPTAPVPFSEPKFNVPAIGLPTARIWTGYNVTGTGVLGSTATSTGSGSSSVGAVFYGANWNVTVSGAGTYDAKAVAKDPWDINTSDFSGITGSTYSLYIPFSMLGGSDVASGGKTSSGYGYDVTYTTATGTETLLDVEVSGSNAVTNVTSDFGSNLRFYLEGDSTTAPTTAATPGLQVDASELRGLISGDVNSNGSLAMPINMGIVLSGIPIPTQTFGDGSVAQVGIDTTAYESAVPEPASFAVLGIGATMLLRRRRLRKSR